MTSVSLIIGKKINVFSTVVNACMHAKKLRTKHSDVIIPLCVEKHKIEILLI